FFLCVHLLPLRAAVGAVAALTLAVVAAQLAGGSGSVVPRILGPCLGAVVAVGMAVIYQRLARESEERRRLVRQLVTAQDDLIAVHDELAETQREAGAVAERARLARDIHDTLAQGFSSIVLLSRAGLGGSDDVATLFGQIEATAADNLEEARRVVHALAPAALEQAPLAAAVDRLLDRLAAQTGIATAMRVDGEPHGTTTSHDVALLRLAQGALANVREHADAGRVAVTLSYDEDAVRLDIVDDGRGFDPERLETARLGGTGFGLRAMRERIADLSGTLLVESAEGDGTAVVATVPRTAGAP
ncbi:MAG: sensor histidine kinase, partial [Nocardioidaceae bacterium]